MNDKILRSDALERKRQDSLMPHDPRFPRLPDDRLILAHYRYSKESGWNDEGEWRYAYLFKALLFSKSYYMAHRVAEKKERLEAVDITDFDRVREVYDDLGPVHGFPFYDWRQKLKPHLFTSSYGSAIRQLCKLDADVVLNDKEPRTKIDNGIESYIIDRSRDRHPPASVVAIPIVGDKRKIMKELQKHVDNLFRETQKTTDSKYTFEIDGQAHVIRAALDAQEIKAKYPDITHQALIDKNYGDGTKKYRSHGNENDAKSSHNASKRGQRYLYSAYIMSENAARGRFFIKEKIAEIEIDYRKLSPREKMTISNGFEQVNKQRKAEFWMIGQKDLEWKTYLGIE
jgi:hypothetical protein